MIPIVLAYTVNQLNILVDIVLAYLLGDGMQSSLWYSERLIQFPLGVFAIAMSVAIFPSMSRFAAKKQFNKLLETLSYAMRIIFIIILPCMAIIVTLKTPIIQLLFERGNFNVLSTSNTAYALFFYSFGLLAYAGIKIILPAYYSIQDSKTPIKFALISLGINIVLNLILMHPLKQGGLALATSIAATVNFLLLSIHINKKIGVLDWEKIFICFIKMLIISIVMGFVCHFTHLFINNIQFNMLKKFYNVFIPISAGFLSLILFGYLFKLNEMFDLFKLFKKTKK